MGSLPKLTLWVNKLLLHQISISKSRLQTLNPVTLVLIALELTHVNYKSPMSIGRTFPLSSDVLLLMVWQETAGIFQAVITL